MNIKKNIKNEIIRKCFHMLFVLVIPLVQYTSIRTAQILILLFSILYYVLEQARLKKINIPIVVHIFNSTLREEERKSFAFAPLTLALGIALVLQLYYFEAMAVSIVAATVGDSVAAVVGKIIRSAPLIWNRKKSLAGIVANFIAVFFLCLLWFPVQAAVIAAIASALVESLDLEHVDNLMVPLSVGAALYLFY